MRAGNDPLVRPALPVDHRPDKSRIVTTNHLKVFAKRFQSVTAPYFILRFRVKNGFEILVENVFMKRTR